MNRLSTAVILTAIITSIAARSALAAIPRSVLRETQTKQLQALGKTVSYKIVYPENRDPRKRYRVALGLSGGPATDGIVDYCYYTMFRSPLLKDRIVIMPVAPFGKNFSQLQPRETDSLLKAIRSAEPVTDSGWVVVGNSNGGIGAFGFAQQQPSLFDGIIVLPGWMRARSVPPAWKTYTVVLAVGDRDAEGWKKATDATAAMLNGKVAVVRKVIMKGQGHVPTPLYHIDTLYRVYFDALAAARRRDGSRR